MPESACSQCEFCQQCPVKKIKGQYRLDHTAKERRTAGRGRRREQDTDVFRERYKTRSGIEGTNSGLKRKVGLGRLRVRGRPAVFHAIYLKMAGWNILRASACAKIRKIASQGQCSPIEASTSSFTNKNSQTNPSEKSDEPFFDTLPTIHRIFTIPCRSLNDF